MEKMVTLLQEAFACIESLEAMLEEEDIITKETQAVCDNICMKLIEEILKNLYHSIKQGNLERGNGKVVLLQESLACIANQRELMEEGDVMTLMAYNRLTNVSTKLTQGVVDLLKSEVKEEYGDHHNYWDINRQLSNNNTCSTNQHKCKNQKPSKPSENTLVLYADKEIKRFQCELCGKLFATGETYNKHFLRTHWNKVEVECEICNKLCPSKTSLLSHKKTHEVRTRQYSCHICGKGFFGLKDLNRHLFVHTGEKPFRCDICERGFSQQAILKRHIMTHTKDKPFSCDLCDQRFSRKTSLTRHMSIHTGEKPFSCCICGKTFSRMYSLHLHSLIHTGEQ